MRSSVRRFGGMEGYDLDDTLAAMDYASGLPLIELYATAPVIYRPTVPFFVITGRRHLTTEERAATVNWLRENQPQYLGMQSAVGRNAKEVAAAKAPIIRDLGLTDYTDNNRKVLAELSMMDTGAQLWSMTRGGNRSRYGPIDCAGLAQRWAPTL